MTTMSDNSNGESTTQTVTPKLAITIPHPSENSHPSRHPNSSSSIQRQPYLYPTPSSPTPYHGIRPDSICSEDEKYYFMSEPSISEDSPSSSNYTPQSSPVYGNNVSNLTFTGARRKTLASAGPTMEESKTSINLLYDNDDDLSEEMEDEDLLRHLKIPPPPPPPPMVPNAPLEETERSTSMTALSGMEGSDRGTIHPPLMDNSDLSYDDSSVDGDFLSAIQKVHRSPNGGITEEVEVVRQEDLCTDPFLTALQESDKSPNFVELDGCGESRYVYGDVVSGRRELLLEPGFDRSDSLEEEVETTVMGEEEEEEGKRSILKVEDSLFPVGGRIPWQQQQVERGCIDPSIGQACVMDPVAVSSIERIRTSTTTRRSHHKHKKPQSRKEDRKENCNLAPKTNNDSNKKNSNSNNTHNNDRNNTKNTETNTTNTTTTTINKKNNSHADEASGHLTLIDNDEQIHSRSRRRRLHSTDGRQIKKRPPGHRRTRSGDDAAATLLTGGTEWIGMELDDLPLPLSQGDDDEDDVFQLAMLEMGGVGGNNDDAGSGIGVGGSRSGSLRRQNSGSDRSSAGKRSGASDNKNNKSNSNGESGGNSRDSRRKPKQQQFSSLKKQKEQGVSSRETSRGPPPNLLDVGTVGDSDDAGNQEEQQRRQQQNQPDWFDLSVGGKYPSFEDNYHSNTNNNNNNNNSNNNYKSRKSSGGIENSAESEYLLSPSSWAHQQQQPHHNNNINNISSNILRPLYAADDRQESIGDASISTIDSHGSHSVFSWISNKISVATGSASKPDYYYHGSSRKDNTDASLNFSDDEDHHGGNGRSVKDEHDFFRVSDLTNTDGEMGNYLGNDRRRRISPKGDGAMEAQLLRHQQRDGSVKGKEHHTRTSTPEFFPNLGNRRSSSVRLERKNYPMYMCPRCKVERRMFFTVNSAPNKILEGPAAYLGIYIGIYMLVSLTILGLEEGWPRLDSIYFSVMTLTTSGLGDYVPSSDSAKIMCSILIYFGIAFIGLLLGTLQANSLDDVSQKADKESMMNNCPNCARLQNSRTTTTDLEGRYESILTSNNGTSSANIPEDEASSLFHNMKTDPRTSSTLHTISETNYGSTCTTVELTPSPESLLLTSTRRSNTVDSSELSTPVALINRQSHTRHSSFEDLRRHITDQRTGNMVESDDSSVSTGQSLMSNAPGNGVEHSIKPVSKVKAAKYVFLTMKQAVANTALIIVVGIVGFYYIERLTLVDAFYFTMVLLTAVGYGDIRPATPEGKLFTSMYCLVAGFVVLKNVSMISTIPLELRKRRLEQAVLTQFGDELDDAALRELASGPLVRRLQISEDQPDDLDKCTREMFALAMLVRLGRITEQDVKLTYAAFQKLDKDHDGVLTSKEIIMSMAVERRKKNGVGRGLSSTSRERDSGGGGEGSWDGGNLQSMDYLSNLSHPLSATQNSSNGRQTSLNGRQTTAPKFSIEGQCFAINHDDVMERGGGNDYRNLV